MQTNFVWKSFANGPSEIYHSTIDPITHTICSIWESPKQIILGINGYRFSGYPNLDKAKLDAEDRLKNNRGIYLKES